MKPLELARRAAVLSCLAALLGACGNTPVSATDGVVTGGIEPCQGAIVSGGPRYAEGTVTVLRGVVTWKPDGARQLAVFPATTVATVQVGRDASYRFALTPGDYVLRAFFPAPVNVQPWVSVAVKPGATVQADIPNMCL